MNITGTYECKADSKGRLMLPSPLKKQLTATLDEGFVLKRSVFANCLELYPMGEWNRAMQTVNGLNRFVRKNVDFIRLFTAGVRIIEMDGTGRILIPKELTEVAGIRSDVVLASAGSYLEVWDKVRYEAVLNDPQVDFAKLAEDVMGNIDAAGDVIP
ncbi:MAG: division/cell wall cluster transcriptional repressor MraZ [Flavobacteriales bacterium]|nr:division/cell wall cluster transcriptional repressor MraZ [Flavobacteriales bacterium]